MPLYKEGDRVRAVIEGTIGSYLSTSVHVDYLDYDGDPQVAKWLPIDSLELIASLLQVGDIVHAYGDPEPSVGTTLVNIDACGWAIRRSADGWETLGDSNLAQWSEFTNDYRVAYVPASQS